MKFNDYEIPQEEWEDLCNKQKDGYEIVADENGYPVLAKREEDLKYSYNAELLGLKEWFNSEYSYKEEKYRRLIALNKADDDGISAQEKLTALYEEAEQKRIRIQELETLI